MQGFAERKLLLLSEVIHACKKIHNDEVRKERLLALKANKQVWSEYNLGNCPLIILSCN